MTKFVYNIETIYGYYLTTDPEEGRIAWKQKTKMTCRRGDYVKGKI